MHETQSNGQIVALIRTVFSLLDFENDCHARGRQHFLSPLLSATLLWFSDRIVRTYFFRVRRISDGVDAPYPRQVRLYLFLVLFVICISKGQRERELPDGFQLPAAV